MNVETIDLGSFVAGEIPEALVVTMTRNGVALNLTGYTAKWQFGKQGEASTTAAATITSPSTGVTRYDWVSGNMATAGFYVGYMWVGNGSQKYASERFVWTVDEGIGTAPTFP